MKLIDHTPFFKDGQISTTDRLKAIWKYGASWLKEVEAQQIVIAILEKGLARGYTLFRNVTLPGLEIEIPLILVGPTGIYVLYVTPLRGTYRARGEEWGLLEGEHFRPARINLLRRTARLGRAVQVYLQKQGFSDLPPVEAVLLGADPGLIVESVRPIVRVVQRDALERFAASISRARVVLGVDRIQQIVNRILNPLPPAARQPQAGSVPAVPAPSQAQESEPYVPPFALPPEMQAESGFESAAGPASYEPDQPMPEVAEQSPPAAGGAFSNLEFGFQFEDQPGGTDAPSVAPPVQPGPPRPAVPAPVRTGARLAPRARARPRKRQKLTGGQIVVLVLMAVIQCVILGVAVVLLWPYLAP